MSKERKSKSKGLRSHLPSRVEPQPRGLTDNCCEGCPEARHCDDYIEDPNAPEALRKYLAFARSPAHGLGLPKPHPELYADHEGTRVRVTMASRLGDVGITTDLSAELGYKLRVAVSQLSNFSEVP